MTHPENTAGPVSDPHPWPSVTPIMFEYHVPGVEWRDGKPWCHVHHVVLVRARQELTDGGTHICHVCVREALGL